MINSIVKFVYLRRNTKFNLCFKWFWLIYLFNFSLELIFGKAKRRDSSRL